MQLIGYGGGGLVCVWLCYCSRESVRCDMSIDEVNTKYIPHTDIRLKYAVKMLTAVRVWLGKTTQTTYSMLFPYICIFLVFLIFHNNYYYHFIAMCVCVWTLRSQQHMNRKKKSWWRGGQRLKRSKQKTTTTTDTYRATANFYRLDSVLVCIWLASNWQRGNSSISDTPCLTTSPQFHGFIIYIRDFDVYTGYVLLATKCVCVCVCKRKRNSKSDAEKERANE